MCGVFGAFSRDGRPVLEDIYLGLFALQHRGQESAGLSWIEGGVARSIKGMGLVHNAISQGMVSSIPARAAIGHVRYSTCGDSILQNAQPLTINYAKGPVAIAHNGNLTNSGGIMRYLEDRGAIFQSTSDTEVILHLMAHQSHKMPLDALMDALRRIRGAFSLVVLLEDRLIAARDPWGFRPLIMGERDGVVYFSSESCALDMVGARPVRDVEPGEVIVVDRSSVSSLRIPVKPRRGFLCSFEFVYFARPDSVIDGISVYDARKNLGRRLAKRCPVKADLVAGMPDSGTVAALGYAEEARCPFEMAIVRNRYVGRTFIQPTQRVREAGVKVKLNPNPSVLSGKEVVVIDDSIVRGTTASRVVNLMRSAGASKVHLRIASPPVRFPCYYGIDTPSSEELAAARFDLDQLTEEVGADSLAYITQEDLLNAIGAPEGRLCTACFSGEYMEDDANGIDL
ncbi:amidophosphoribosyltransferase [Thermanaerovibrio acidaminovorans]|uniref:Amidophosphoribosyltransferase n=1 Tax=Thermanaerovibrio acidaminovorans (strain ATCC 49978 / DSM 6589 / Su883) TaxID=525903 RepID=D1B9P0_THEAS|nr:amidophosphoribosyltransferase [Thermanaerovibrio acidaminovorans]ACZ18993.1 amidophosphoribosyltransferase [Thermanaerovibrio acidaminovorans DSM 6589]